MTAPSADGRFTRAKDARGGGESGCARGSRKRAQAIAAKAPTATATSAALSATASGSVASTSTAAVTAATGTARAISRRASGSTRPTKANRTTASTTIRAVHAIAAPSIPWPSVNTMKRRDVERHLDERELGGEVRTRAQDERVRNLREAAGEYPDDDPLQDVGALVGEVGADPEVEPLVGERDEERASPGRGQ